MSGHIFNKWLVWEEKIETRKKKSFFKEHERIIDFFIYYFIGVFVVFFVIATINPGWVFSEEQLYGEPTIEINTRPGLPPPPSEGVQKEIFKIFRNNFYVMMISFVLSLLYGSGALFLIILNSSIFASKLVQVIRAQILSSYDFIQTFSLISCNFGILFFHMLPEMGAYLVAAISGGVLSKAVIREKFMSKKFLLVIKDSVLLLFLSIVLLMISAFLEIKVSKELFIGNICIKNISLILVSTISLVFAVILAEWIRMRNKKR